MSIYEQYGKLMVQKELLDSKILQVKQMIQEDINKVSEPEAEEKVEE